MSSALNSKDFVRVLRSYGWPAGPAEYAADLLAWMCRKGTVTRQQADAVLLNVHDEYAGAAADRGEHARDIHPRETERITAALGWGDRTNGALRL